MLFEVCLPRSLPILLALAACAQHRRVQVPVDVDAMAFSRSEGTPVDDRWWQAFEAPDLDEAVGQALADNFDVQAAYARLTAAEAAVRRDRGPLFPSLGAYADSSIGTDDPFGGLQRVPVEIGLQASYEIDLWGRIRAAVRARAERREASRFDARTAALSVAAELTETWIAIAATREQLALLDDQIEANEQMAAVVRSRVLNGVVRQADSLRQDRLVEQTRAARVARLEDLEVLEHQLAVLLGRSPTEPLPVLPERLPAPPPLPSAGVPSELMRRRPDVRAAEHRLFAVDADVGEAIANQFPRFTLRGAVSNAPSSPEALLTGWIASLAASLAAPIFEGGQRRAEVKRTRALLDAEIATYSGVLLTAAQEVEDALARNRRQEQAVALIDTQVALARQTAENLQLQYIGGLDVGYLDVLTAQTTAQQLRRQQIEARQRLLTLRVGLYRALAGGVDPQVEATDG